MAILIHGSYSAGWYFYIFYHPTVITQALRHQLSKWALFVWGFFGRGGGNFWCFGLMFFARVQVVKNKMWASEGVLCLPNLALWTVC